MRSGQRQRGAQQSLEQRDLVSSQFKQVLVLPISFFGYGSIGIRGSGGPMDRL